MALRLIAEDLCNKFWPECNTAHPNCNSSVPGFDTRASSCWYGHAAEPSLALQKNEGKAVNKALLWLKMGHKKLRAGPKIAHCEF